MGSYTDRAADVAADGLGTEMDLDLLKYGPAGTLVWQRYDDTPESSPRRIFFTGLLLVP